MGQKAKKEQVESEASGDETKLRRHTEQVYTSAKVISTISYTVISRVIGRVIGRVIIRNIMG